MKSVPISQSSTIAGPCSRVRQKWSSYCPGCGKNAFGQVNLHIYLSKGKVDWRIFAKLGTTGQAWNAFGQVDLQISCPKDKWVWKFLSHPDAEREISCYISILSNMAATAEWALPGWDCCLQSGQLASLRLHGMISSHPTTANIPNFNENVCLTEGVTMMEHFFSPQWPWNQRWWQPENQTFLCFA